VSYESQRRVSLADISDEALATSARHQLPADTSAYDELVRRHYDSVRRLATAQLGAPDEADALAQDVMLRVFSGLKNFRGDAKFSTWLFRIVENLARTRVRQQMREQDKRQALGMAQDERGEDAPDQSDFQRLLAVLSPEERALLALRFVEDMELHEIAAVLGLSLSATKMRYYRTLDKLKDHIPG
jgi:RNA polymerase sigma-70 factor (ECF subfamily)